MDGTERARKSADAMLANDNAAHWFGMSLESVDEGRATLSLTVAAEHANGHGICHGGVIFALADTAFAYACNSRNQNTVAQQNSITYLMPALVGDTLTASAVEFQLRGRSGITDVTVTSKSGEVIAVFRGHSRSINGHLFEEQASD